jgi:capsule polysaccharide export protein KpsE/RkpR
MSDWESDNPFEGRMTHDLEDERSQLEDELDAAKRLAPESERIPVLENRLEALHIELNRRRSADELEGDFWP